ncbi:hypothetical protein AB833_02190 [Chromatiales bacterium (ex Bugula neritina AB1)]|nr:hypothetical protein AB833_02190 [Chromatiales bacterium (ex Bugula neritina AB1)]
MSSKRTHVFTGSVYEDLAGYSRAIIVGDRIFVSGTVGMDFDSGKLADGPEAQTDKALDIIEKCLKDAGSGLGDIVRTRVYIPDPEHVMPVSKTIKNRVGFTYPANTTICSPLAVPGADVEIEVEAIRGSCQRL